MNTPAVSILIATHNDEKTLDQCLGSLQQQTYQDFRIVCVNDASTDTTGDILLSWQKRIGTEKFRIIRQIANIGLTRSLNAGLEKIDTPYTARIDADDWWAPEKLEIQMRFLMDNPSYGIVGCAYINIAHGKEKSVFLPETDAELKKMMFHRNPFAHSCVVFETDLVKKVGGYDRSIYYGQDYELWLRISPQTKFHNIPKILCYRNASSGISHSNQNAQLWQYVKTQCIYIKKLHRPITDYRFIFEPLLTIVTPQWVRAWKRKHL